MTDADRAALSAAVVRQRERKYGTAKAAYVAAGVNAGTWSRAESGKTVRPDLLRKIVLTLWPDSDGDWAAVVGGDADDAGYVPAPGARADIAFPDIDINAQVLDAIREMRAGLHDELREVRERLDRLEQRP